MHKISVVTPSYNQAQFLETTILSVLNQGYPNLEYIIIDGGSTDGSIDIIKKYENQLTYWISEKDNGQAEAINKGFNIATGDILSWLNSDDYYKENTLNTINNIINPENSELVFGNVIMYDQNKNIYTEKNIQNIYNKYNLSIYDYIIQPSSFWTRKAWEQTGELNSDFNYVFDWEWYIRAKKAGINFIFQNHYFSTYRIHDNHKSSFGGKKRNSEIETILKCYSEKKYSDAFQFIKQNELTLSKIYSITQKLTRNRFSFGLFKILYPHYFLGLTNSEILQLYSNSEYY